MKFSHQLIVSSEDIDEHKHVNNVAYLRWVQDVAVAHWEAEASFDLQSMFTWFVLRHEIDYKGRAFEGDLVTAETWVGKATRIKCERFSRILRDEEVLVEAKSIWCLLNSETQRPTRVTEELRAMFKML